MENPITKSQTLNNECDRTHPHNWVRSQNTTLYMVDMDMFCTIRTQNMHIGQNMLLTQTKAI